ncbi:MAG: hypothetical protein IKK23_00135, partial [Bacteroidales bacterium]|nr:hypothetical protein [Bacteroidales bacterium]
MENLNIHISKSVFKNKIVYIGLFVAFVIMLLCYPNEGKFKYDYHKGRPWLYETLTAPIDFPVLKTPAELMAERDEAASKVIPYYTYDSGILNEQLHELSRRESEALLADDIEVVVTE